MDQLDMLFFFNKKKNALKQMDLVLHNSHALRNATVKIFREQMEIVLKKPSITNLALFKEVRLKYLCPHLQER